MDTSDEEQNSWSASDEEVKALAEMAVKIEKHYGRPMDHLGVCNAVFFEHQQIRVWFLNDDRIDCPHGKEKSLCDFLVNCRIHRE